MEDIIELVLEIFFDFRHDFYKITKKKKNFKPRKKESFKKKLIDKNLKNFLDKDV